MDKESVFLRQKIDCNCSDCGYMVRDNEKLKAHIKTYKGTGLMDRLNFGYCKNGNKDVSFIPNVCMIKTQGCFVHRKELLK